VANPTTNYGFVLPTSSDLVTDLPADFDVALQGVDTRLKALQPGTTLGDLAYSSATANTNVRLPIGSNGNLLTISGGVPAWTSAAGGGMTLLSTTTASGSSTSVSITPTGYNEIVIVTTDLTLTTDGDLFLRINNDTTAANYTQTLIAVQTAGLYTQALNNIAGVNSIIPTVVGLPPSGTNIAQFNIPQPNLTSRKLIRSASSFRGSGSVNVAQMTVCNYTTTAALSSVQVFTSAGAFNGGSILVYGVK
jgi:hypothetical protein